MDRSCLRLSVLFVFGVIAGTPNLLTGQQSPATGTPVHMAQSKRGAASGCERVADFSS